MIKTNVVLIYNFLVKVIWLSESCLLRNVSAIAKKIMKKGWLLSFYFLLQH